MKYMKMAAIALMALALFSCNNKNNEPKNVEAAALTIRLNDSQLRAVEGEIADKTKTEITDKVTIKLFPSGREINLTPQQITEAKDLTNGTKITVGEAVSQVSIVKANAEITDETEITAWQGKAEKFTTEIPLTAPATDVEESTDGDNTIYSVTLQPVPAFARVEVAGKIVGQENETSHLNAFDDISVEAVYINNYLLTRNAQKRYFTEGEKGAFKADPALKTEMYDKIATGDKEAFEKKEKVAGYQLFPIKKNEAEGTEFYDHIILKLNIKYSDDAQKAGLPATATRFVTMTKFMVSATGDLKSFEAGKIYKLDLAELSKDFKTNEDGTPDPSNPDKEDPEQKGDKILVVKVKPYEWTAVNIKPDVYK
ncbi:hypothetical protein [uncultured Porphyromonas sp.]|uniref:hypothetical protein n=1 Tax=uncultured Porphyromonas sp. TaxID=159274 RepID=UPI00260D1387|nr:hypothetical protein [uncultured Porphyromonas sp.]